MEGSAREVFEQRKRQEIDPFGVKIQGLNANEITEQVTPYDSFLLEDSLRLVTAGSELDSIKKKMESRLREDGLYVVTVGDVNSEYYHFATMFNRLSNKGYSTKVWRSVNLLQNIFRGLRQGYTEQITKAVSQHSFDEAMNQDANKHM